MQIISSGHTDRVEEAHDDYTTPLDRLIEENRVLRETLEAHRQTLRDQFAMAALPAIYNRYAREWALDSMAVESYETADAMLKVRGRG